MELSLSIRTLGTKMKIKPVKSVCLECKSFVDPKEHDYSYKNWVIKEPFTFMSSVLETIFRRIPKGDKDRHKVLRNSQHKERLERDDIWFCNRGEFDREHPISWVEITPNTKSFPSWCKRTLEHLALQIKS